MTTPIRFHGFDGDRRLLVLVGKSDRLREVTVTRDQAARIIATLAYRLEAKEWPDDRP